MHTARWQGVGGCKGGVRQGCFSRFSLSDFSFTGPVVGEPTVVGYRA